MASAVAAAAAPSAAPPPLPPPQPLPYDRLRAATAGWHPLAVIGEGGFGTVYRGVIDLGGGLSVPVAIKRQQGQQGAGATGGPTGGGGDTGGAGAANATSSSSSSWGQGGAEFAAEVALLRRLQHPNLVRLVGWCDPTSAAAANASAGPAPSGNPFKPPTATTPAKTPQSTSSGERCLVYELCAGGSLEDALARPQGSSALPWLARLAVAAQLASAVAALHAASPCPVYHGDIKPANVLLLLADAARAAGGGGGGSSIPGVGGGVTAKLADVGLAREVGGGATAAAAAPRPAGAGTTTQSEPQVRGDWAYLPPEARATGAVGPRSDAYALGVTLLQLATGEVEGRLHELPLRARLAAASSSASSTAAGNSGGGLASLLDPRAGGWDAAAGERLLRVALWLCSDRPEERPTAATAAAALARLHLAAERERERAGRRERERAEALAQAWAEL